MNTYFEKVCELDIIMNLEKAHYILEELVQNGQLQEACKQRALYPVRQLDLKKF